MIVVAGEALIDLVPQGVPTDGGPVTELPALAPRLGGGPYNTAVALGRLGSSVAFCSRVSRDAFGEALLGGLRAAGVDVSPVQRGDEPTTLAVASIGADGSAGYSFYVEGTADRLFAVPEALPTGTRAVSFGTCSLALEPGATAYEDVMRSAAAQGLCTALDPNIRAGLIPDADAYRARFKSWLASTTLLKLSEEDAEWLGGTPQEWLAAGPAAVVITRGGEGLTALTRDGASTRCRASGSTSWTRSALVTPSTPRCCTGFRAWTPSPPPGSPGWAATTGPGCCGSPRGRRRSPAHGRARSRRTRPNWWVRLGEVRGSAWRGPGAHLVRVGGPPGEAW